MGTKKIKYLIASFVMLNLMSCTVIAPITASRAEIGSLRGTSKSTVLFNSIYLNKNYGIKEAANNGNINSAISTVDEKTTSFLLFSKKTLIVTAK
jgi:hypothetical protein